MRPESTHSGHRVSWPAILVLCLVPLLAVATLLGLANHDRNDQVQAAIVNLDQMVEVNGQQVPMGRQLASAIIGREGDNITWTLADAKDANEGLKSGEYAAVVTIPQEFSAAATSYSANDGAVAKQATIDVAVSDNAPVTDAGLAQQIARIASETINSTLTSGYLDNIYVGFNEIGQQFTTIVDGAEQLSDGAAQLADGTDQSSDGAAQLADGMTQVKTGSTELRAGGEKLDDGGQKLLNGTDELVSQSGQLLDNLPAYTDGVAQTIGGVSTIKAGVDQMVDGVQSAAVNTSAFDPLIAGTQQLADGATGVSGGLTTIDQTLQAFASGQAPAPAEVSAIGTQIKSQFTCQAGLDAQTCAAMQAAFNSGVDAALPAGFQAGTGTASAALNTKDATTGQSVISGAAQLASGAQELATGAKAIPDQVAASAEESTAQLVDGLQQLSDGAGTLVTKAQPLVTNGSAIADGSTQLSDGLETYQAGVTDYVDGVGEYVSGVEQYTTGVDSAADGVQQLSDGLAQLDTGAQRLADGSKTFATELAKGADQVPSYSQADRQALSTVVADPVATDDSLTDNGRFPLTALVLVSGLWLAALAAFVIARPIASDIVAAQGSSVGIWGRAVGLPAAVVAVQGLVLGVVGGSVLDVSIGRTAGLMAFLALLGVSFVLANHALAAWFGNVGRGISLLLLVLTIGVGLTSALPNWLETAAGVSPLQNGLDLVRTWVSEGSGLTGATGLAVLLGVIALALSYASIATRRELTVDQFRRRIA